MLTAVTITGTGWRIGKGLSVSGRELCMFPVFFPEGHEFFDGQGLRF